MDAGLLDTLVKLAALGTSGVCIFAIFWIGWLILHLPEGATPERHKTLRMFMIITVIIAVISGAVGFVNAKFNAWLCRRRAPRVQHLQFPSISTSAMKSFSIFMWPWISTVGCESSLAFSNALIVVMALSSLL